MKPLIYLFLLLWLTVGCETQKTVPEPPQGSIQLTCSTSTKLIVLSGFYQDQQISIDTLYPKNGEVLYEVKNKFHSGIYRLQLGNNVYEFLYPDEDIKMTVIEKEGQTYLKELNSKTNQQFLGFLEGITKMNQLPTDSSDNGAQKQYNDFFAEWMEKTKKTNEFLFRTISFLNQPDFKTYLLLHPTYKKNEIQYLTEDFFNAHYFDYEGLVYTPYYYVCIFNYLNSLTNASDEIKDSVCDRVRFLAGRNTENLKFVNQMLKSIWNK